jgi:hypothetical protein
LRGSGGGSGAGRRRNPGCGWRCSGDRKAADFRVGGPGGVGSGARTPLWSAARMPPLTGIGLTLSPNAASGALRVTAMDPEGPAAKGGLIIPGDMLYEVDDTR